MMQFYEAGYTYKDVDKLIEQISENDKETIMQSFCCGEEELRSSAEFKLYEKGYVTYPRTNTEYLATAEKGSVGALLEKLGIDMEKTKTVEIGMDLKKVFQNEETLQSVVEKTKKEIAKVINSNRETDVQMERTSTRGEIGMCPICGGNVMEGKKNYYCSNYKEKNCGFVLWKVVAKKELTKEQIIQLLEKRKTSLIKGFTKNAGGTFSACLVLDEEGKVGFQFPKRKK